MAGLVDEDEEVVQLLYHGVLGRQPDEAGFLHNVARLREAKRRGHFTGFLRSFIDSAEANRNRVLGRFPNIMEPRPELAMPAFRHALSIGSTCYPSWLLKSLGLKQFSGPFDWIFSSLPMTVHCLEDDFGEFLNPAHFEPLRLKDPKLQACRHGFYQRHFGIDCVFNHHDPSREEALRYFERCVGRFRTALSSEAPTMLLFVGKRNEVMDSDLARLSGLLNRRRGRARLVAILLSEGSPEPVPSFRFEQRPSDDGSVLIDYHPVSTLKALGFTSSFDELVVRRFLKSLPFALTPLDGGRAC